MKKIILILVITTSLFACSNNGSETKSKLDSLATQVDTTAEKVWDSTKAGAKELKNKIEGKFENKKDSLDKDSVDRK